VGDLVLPGARDGLDGALDALVLRARTLDAPELLGFALALRAAGAAYRDDSAALLADAGRAVAVVDDDELPALDRCTVLVVAAAAYNTLSLWELNDDLYRQASVLAPACDEPVMESAVAVNRVLLRMEWASALFEIGDEEAALEQLSRAADAVRLATATPDVSAAWQLAVRAADDVLAFVRQAFGGTGTGPVPVEHHLGLLDGHRRLLEETGDVEVLPLLEALLCLGLLRTGHRDAALARLGRLDLATSSSSGARSFSSWVRAQVLTGPHPDPAVAAHRDHGLLVSRLRWTARRSVLTAARATIAGERLSVEHALLARDILLDPLTGLANRRCFDDWLTRPHAETRATALLLIDLDDFKTVNDLHGHAVGDDTLRRVARLVDQHVRPGDMALRLGGDEFAVVLEPGHDDPEQLSRTAHGRAAALAEAVARVDWDRVADGLAVSISVGVAVAVLGPQDPGAADDLYRRADTDLYVAKGDRTRQPWTVGRSG
jgi:diguanylate cyclase (GGDEF)-like protein